MSSLFIDTAYKYLTVVVEENDKVLASYSEECFKKQSEQLFMILDDLFTKNKLSKEDIDSVYITEGPGSYTGVRIGMTLAKVLCQTKKIKLYTISTLKLYSGNKPNTMVVMDARAKRAYVGVYNEGKCLLEDQAIELVKIDPKNYDVVLDGNLIGKQDKAVDIVEAFIKMKSQFDEVKDINYLVPKYLKESNEYYR